MLISVKREAMSAAEQEGYFYYEQRVTYGGIEHAG